MDWGAQARLPTSGVDPHEISIIEVKHKHNTRAQPQGFYQLMSRKSWPLRPDCVPD